ncbi:MAG: hypothetical protein NVSMB42_06700 [Herpetosiphon sp.]
MSLSSTPSEPQRLRRVVIKEELVALTGHWRLALILNQFLYWAERHADFDRFIAEEQRRSPDVTIEPTYGWIYKSCKELKSELMSDVSEPTMRRDITQLVYRGWLLQRHNPQQRWDRELQYRPAIRTIQRDLQALGYALDGYPLLLDPEAPEPVTNAFVTMNNAFVTMNNAFVTMKNRFFMVKQQYQRLRHRLRQRVRQRRRRRTHPTWRSYPTRSTSSPCCATSD